MNQIFENIDYNNFIHNLNGIGTFITSLIIIFTLIVLIRQRKYSFRPRVIFGDRVSWKCIPLEDDASHSKWEDVYLDKTEDIHDFCFHLLNIGVGVAENFTVYEQFNYIKAMKFIKNRP